MELRIQGFEVFRIQNVQAWWSRVQGFWGEGLAILRV